MSGYLLPRSARRAAELLVECGGDGARQDWRADQSGQSSAGESERMELVSGIAEHIAALRRAVNTDSAEMGICVRLLRHLSQPSNAAAECHTSSLQ